MKRLLHAAMLTLCACVALCHAAGQAPETPGDLRALMRDVCNSQAQMLQRRDTRLRYQIQRVDRKGTTLRDQIESHDGGVARLLQHNGHALTVAENEGERERLGEMLGGNKLEQRTREEAKTRNYGVDLLVAMPKAMLFSLAPQQTPLPDIKDRQLVVDFEPDPAFHAANLQQQILVALRGRAWIDLNDHNLLKVDLHNFADVNLAWGLLAKVYAGGSLSYEQRKFDDIYAFTHIEMHMRLRELMVKTAAIDTETTVGAFQRLQNSPTEDEAIRMLLARPVATVDETTR